MGLLLQDILLEQASMAIAGAALSTGWEGRRREGRGQKDMCPRLLSLPLRLWAQASRGQGCPLHLPCQHGAWPRNPSSWWRGSPCTCHVSPRGGALNHFPGLKCVSTSLTESSGEYLQWWTWFCLGIRVSWILMWVQRVSSDPHCFCWSQATCLDTRTASKSSACLRRLLETPNGITCDGTLEGIRSHLEAKGKDHKPNTCNFLLLFRHSATPQTAACQVPLSSTISRSLLRFMSIEPVMLSNHLILWHSLLFFWFQSFSASEPFCIRWPKYYSFSFSISLSSEYSGLVSFRIDWFDLLAVQGALNKYNNNCI